MDAHQPGVSKSEKTGTRSRRNETWSARRRVALHARCAAALRSSNRGGRDCARKEKGRQPGCRPFVTDRRDESAGVTFSKESANKKTQERSIADALGDLEQSERDLEGALEAYSRAVDSEGSGLVERLKRA